jgi:glycosyltransferase involved in cell wall biosynthesis
MTVGTFSKRKAPMEMMEVYLREFKDEDGVRLIWKIGSIADPGQMLILRREIQRMAFRIGADMSEAPRIILDMNTYDHDLMNELYNEADCMVQVSHGEAWGLPILNAMATGTPSLVLKKGGHRAFCTAKNSFFVKEAGLIYADGKDDWYAVQNGVRWWKIDMDDYQKQMRYVFDNREEIITKGQEGKLKAKKFTWNNVVRMGYKIFNKYDNLLVSRYERN